jgi:hypothetical protein
MRCAATFTQAASRLLCQPFEPKEDVMAYRQYTSCVEPGNYQDLGFTYLIGLGIEATAVSAFIAAMASGAFVAVLVGAIAAFVVLITFLIWWLYGRLICLDDVDKCVIGAAIGKPSSDPGGKGGDDDSSFNVVLAPSAIDLFAAKDPGSEDDYSTRLPETKEHYWDNPLQGEVVTPNQKILDIGRGYVSDAKHMRYLKSVHSEFEGSGIRNLLAWANIVLAVLILALIASSVPGLGIFLAVIALILSIFFGVTAFTGPLNPGDPADVGINQGELVAGKVIAMKGNWVYDSLHEGWNEIHAIHACQIIGETTDGKTWPKIISAPGGGTVELDLGTPEGVKEAIGIWCLSFKQAEDAEGGGNRDDPAQNWVVHPLIDGCSRVIIL